MTRDIDDSGEIAANVAPKLFEEMVDDLARSVTVLHRAGYRRVVIGTDHGFLLIPSGVESAATSGPRQWRRNHFEHAIRRRADLGRCRLHRLPAEPDGTTGSSNVVLPKGLTAFGVGGPAIVSSTAASRPRSVCCGSWYPRSPARRGFRCRSVSPESPTFPV